LDWIIETFDDVDNRHHAGGRAFKALGISKWSEVKATIGEARQVLRDYVEAKAEPKADHEPEPGAMCDACGEQPADTDNPEDPALCPACATLKADAEAQQQELISEPKKKRRSRTTKRAIEGG